jgi:hypothetical protein
VEGRRVFRNEDQARRRETRTDAGRGKVAVGKCRSTETLLFAVTFYARNLSASNSFTTCYGIYDATA